MAWARYRGEPYVVAADVYAAAGHIGQSGWTWYTGSAGWMYRIWIEEVLGFRLRGHRFRDSGGTRKVNVGIPRPPARTVKSAVEETREASLQSLA